ncbi:unnamed protein product [Lathyrus sativus]|nr:unnamed protein product [Lathyrus sativus]
MQIADLIRTSTSPTSRPQSCTVPQPYYTNSAAKTLPANKSQYKSHVYANPDNVTPAIVESRYALTKQKGARYLPATFLTGLLDPATFLTGLLDPATSREEFLQLFADLEGKVPVFVVSSKGSPKRSKAEMEALKGAKGVTKFVEVPGALLPQEEYPDVVAEELYQFLQQYFGSVA